jgi:hypothetical protein
MPSRPPTARSGELVTVEQAVRVPYSADWKPRCGPGQILCWGVLRSELLGIRCCPRSRHLLGDLRGRDHGDPADGRAGFASDPSGFPGIDGRSARQMAWHTIAVARAAHSAEIALCPHAYR